MANSNDIVGTLLDSLENISSNIDNIDKKIDVLKLYDLGMAIGVGMNLLLVVGLYFFIKKNI